MDATDEQPKRKRTFRQEGASRKKPKSENDGMGKTAAFSGFGARMMAKMGYKGEGGLGREGSGIAEPISVKLREARTGIGAHGSEKTAQQKREERRKAEDNGEEYVDSSEEEKRARRRKKASGPSTGTSTPISAARKQKTTIVSIEESGMKVPLSLTSILDASSGKAVTSLSLRGAEVNFQSSLAARVQRELTAFGNSVEEMVTDSKSIQDEIDSMTAQLQNLDDMMADTAHLRSQLQKLADGNMNTIVEGLKSLQKRYPLKRLDREAVAVIKSSVEASIAKWDPTQSTLEDIASALQDIRSILDPSRTSDQQTDASDTGSRRSTTPYQSLMLMVWTKLQSSMLSLQPDDDCSVFVQTLDTWSPVLPAFILGRITRELKRSISEKINKWNPRKQKRLPDWIFQWLSYVPHIFTELKSKIRLLFQVWPIQRGVISGIQLWQGAFRSEIDQLLIKFLLPLLATYMRDDFVIDPSDQNLEPLTAILAWSEVLGPRVIAELLHVEFFTNKFFGVLHSWLTYEERSLDEISTWLEWWRAVFQKDIADIPLHQQDWETVYQMVNAALDLENEGQSLENLELPAPEPVQSASPGTPNFSKSVNTEPPRAALQDTAELGFKHIVEDWCAEADLLLIPLRKADEATGFPLFRITASATGKGGVIVYFKGDVIYTQNKKDKAIWDPAGLDDKLIARAEGK
jgi:tuftelin-interacting protein 11